MTREEITEKLKLILKYTVQNPDEVIAKVTEDSDLYTDLGLSSVGMLYIVIAIEEMFGIKFDNVSFDTFGKVRDVIDYIADKTAR